jgi:hypothetical protein
VAKETACQALESLNPLERRSPLDSPKTLKLSGTGHGVYKAMLRGDVVPKTAENFRALCTAGAYTRPLFSST